MAGNRKVRQDSAYVSNVSDADFAHFMAIPDMTRAKFVGCIKFLVGVNGRRVQINEDMRLAPARYGFKDSADAARWQSDLQMAIISQQ